MSNLKYMTKKKQLTVSYATVSIVLSLIALSSVHVPVLSQATGISAGLPPTTNTEIQKDEVMTEARLKKAKDPEAADALYDLGKFCHEAHDPTRAMHYMKMALTYEEKVNRPKQLCTIHIALGTLLSQMKKYEEAIAEYKIALQIAESNKHKEVQKELNEFIASSVNGLGFMYLKLNKFDEAKEMFHRAFDLAAEEKDPFLQINALINEAALERTLKHPDKAVEILRQAVTLADTAEPDRSLGQALLSLATTQHDLGKLDDSVASYKKAIEIFKGDLDSESEARACWEFGETLFDLGRIAESRNYFNRALETLKEEPDSPAVTSLRLDAMLGLGSAEADLGKTDKAIDIHKKAYNLSEATKNKPKQLISILQLGYDHLLGGEPEAGLFRFLEGERIINQGGVDAKLKGSFFIGIGRCYKTLGEQAQAQKYYEEAMQLFDAIGDKQSKALALTSLAVLALDNKNWDDFELYNKAAKDIYSFIDSKGDLARMDFNYGQYMLMKGKIPEAIQSYQKALEVFKQMDDRVSEGKTLRSLGLCEFFAGRPQQALQNYEQSMKVATESQSTEALWEAHLGMGKCYKRLGLNDLALAHLNEAVEQVEKERGKITHDSFKTNNLNDRANSFQELVDLYIRMNKPYEALAVAEKGRARAFLDMLSGKRSGITTLSTPLASNTPGATPAQSGTGATPIATAPVIKRNIAQNLVAMAEPGTRGVSVLPKTTQVQNAFAVSTANAAAPDIEEIKTLVKNSKNTVVEYFLLGDRIAVWVVDPDSTVHMLPPLQITKEQLEERVALAYQAITSHAKAQSEVAGQAQRRQQALRELYDLLMKPVESHLPKNEHDVVTIVPHGAMFMIPFAALMSEDNKYFVEKHTLAYMPAIGVMRATQKLEEKYENEPDKLLAFGNPITKKIEFLGALPYSEKEVQNVAALFGADKAVVKIGQSADKKTFLELAP
ncbi:MAG: tetratricopeptide repeat protein, partial [Candidatus Obscuribacterales bacterium]|nr:tetratricopeptide repeat protein [Candidatus Obscuribacterales bacterium]